MEKDFVWTDELVEEAIVYWMGRDTPIASKILVEVFIKHKQSPPLFTTEDGKLIFEGGKWWVVCPDEDLWETHEATVYEKELNVKRFSTKEAAEGYVILNKPCISLKNVESILVPHLPYREAILEELKKLIKSKINGS